MSTVDQALPVTPTWLHAEPPALTWIWLAWRTSGKDRAFAPCPERQAGEAATALGYTLLQEVWTCLVLGLSKRIATF